MRFDGQILAPTSPASLAEINAHKIGIVRFKVRKHERLILILLLFHHRSLEKEGHCQCVNNNISDIYLISLKV